MKKKGDNMQEQLNQLELFCEENPFDFQKEQLDKIKRDITNPRDGVVCDEYVDFELWMRGFCSRQEYFAEYIEKVVEVAKWDKGNRRLKLLEVGCGRNARLSKLLWAKGYEMTAMDPILISRVETTKEAEATKESEFARKAETTKVIETAKKCEFARKAETTKVTEAAKEREAARKVKFIKKDLSTDINYIQEAFCYGKTDITEFDIVVAQEPCEATEHIVRACVEAEKTFIISLCGTPHRLINGEMPEDVYQWYDYLETIGGKNCLLARPKLIPGYVCTVLLGGA
ncbi:MAG: hypothetical protein IJF07_01535 [Lachnospiraceae bacterium]|nr:hypothetical protein [Lachnospiraceae bacterium]